MLQEVASLEAPVSEDDELTLGDSIADKYSLEDDVAGSCKPGSSGFGR